MKRVLVLLIVVLLVPVAQAATLKFQPVEKIALDPAIEGLPLGLKVGLHVPDDVRSTIHVIKTSPFDKIKYPIGVYTADLFAKTLEQVFSEVVSVQSHSAPGVDAVVEVSIVRFEAEIPHPAYNPYTAKMLYKVTVFDAEGEVLFAQTVTGDGQTSKGMVSGFKAKTQASKAAVAAMTDAARQALEALAEAPELTETTAN